MKRTTQRLLQIAAGICAMASLAGAQGLPGGAVFVMTNDATSNEIISYGRDSSGQLFTGGRFETGGRGSGGVTDPLQSQASLTLSQDHTLLFAANAGSGSVSVFRVRGASLTLLDQAPSAGSEPLSIAQNGSLVYVLNGAAAGSVVGFRWDDHQLRQIPNSTVFLSATSAGGSSIAISPDTKWLVVVERLTNSIDTFPIQPNGTLGPIVVNKSAGPGVFSASFAPDGALIASETGPPSALSSYSIQSNGTLSAISQSVPTLGMANCWNAITPNGQWAYVSNAGSSNISGFTIGKTGALTPIDGTVVGINPAGSGNLDIAVSSDGKFVYTINSAAGTIGSFAIQPDGSLLLVNETGGLPMAVGFNGIAAL